MRRLLVYKLSALVVLFVFTSAQAGAQTAPGTFVYNPACASVLNEQLAAKGAVYNYCKEDKQKEYAKGGLSADAAVQACLKEIKDCSDLKQEEVEFDELMVTNVYQGMGMQLPDIATNRTSKCSKYSSDKLESLIERARSQLGTTKRDEKDSVEKNQRDEETYSEKSARLQEDFIKDQEARAKAEIDSKESARERQAAFDKQKQDYESHLRQLDQDIFKLQQQLSLMVAQRGSEVNRYKQAILVCRSKVREFSKSLTMTNTVSSLNRAGKRAGDRNSEIKTLWDSCTDQALKDRISEADKYKVAVETVNMEIQSKSAEISAIRTSLQKVTQMFNQAAQDQALADQKAEEAFMKKQAQKLQQVMALDQQMLKKRMENQKAIIAAQMEVTEASNYLKDLKTQEPAGDKSRFEIGKDISKGIGAEKNIQIHCKTEQQQGTANTSTSSPSEKSTSGADAPSKK